MVRRRRPLSRVPGFRPAPYIEFMERMYSDVGITEDDMHVTEYAGETFVTPPLIDKEDPARNGNDENPIPQARVL